MKICIILNGIINNHEIIKNIIIKNKYDYIICADGGTNHINKMDIIPDYIVGDLDSIEDNLIKFYEKSKVNFKKFPTKKDHTDAEIAIYMAKDLKATEVHLFGALGGRIDHTIANINLLCHIKSNKINPVIISEKEEIYLASNEEVTIEGNKGEIISILPIGGSAKGVTLKNLEYPLTNYDMRYDLPLGMSNVFLENECHIKVNDGNLLIIKNKK